jgi:hypothetical protein
MGVRRIEIPWDSQPQEAVEVNSDLPAPSFLWGFNGGAERSIVGNASTRVGAGTHTVVPTAAGIGLSSNNASNRIQIADNQNIVAPTSTAFSVLQLIRLNSTGQTNRYSAIQFRRGSPPDTQQAIIYGYSANAFEFYTDNFTGTDPRSGSGIVINDTAPHTLLYTYDGATWSGYLDGARVFSVARTFSVNITATPVLPESCLLSANNGTNALDATLLLHAAWPVGLPDNLAREIARNPWQLFAPRRIWVPVSAGVGVTVPTLSAATVTEITATSARPRVTTTAASAGTLYAVIYPAFEPDPIDDEVIEGFLGISVWNGNTTAPTTSGAFDWPTIVSSLSPSTAYKVAFCWSDGVEKSNISISAEFSTTSGLTPVSADFTATYEIRQRVSADFAASYSVISRVAADFSAAYEVRQRIARDFTASYDIVALGVVTADFSAAYLVNSRVSQDFTAAYNLRQRVAADFAATYLISSRVEADFAAAYDILARLARDFEASYSLRSLVERDFAGAYSISSRVTADFDASYALRQRVARDFLAEYELLSLGVVATDFSGAYLINSRVEQSFTAEYALLLRVFADFNASYFIETPPTGEDIPMTGIRPTGTHPGSHRLFHGQESGLTIELVMGNFSSGLDFYAPPGYRGDSLNATGATGNCLLPLITLPADAETFFRAEIVDGSFPRDGFILQADGKFFVDPGVPNGLYSFTFRWYRNGVAQSPLVTRNVYVGPSGSLSINCSMGAFSPALDLSSAGALLTINASMEGFQASISMSTVAALSINAEMGPFMPLISLVGNISGTLPAELSEARQWVVVPDERLDCYSRGKPFVLAWEKDPSSSLDYSMDWRLWVQDIPGDAIANMYIYYTDGISIPAQAIRGTVTAILVNGGTVGKPERVTIRVVTTRGRVDERTMNFKIRDR